MAAAPKRLNPQAPEYMPLFNASSITAHLNNLSLIHGPSSSPIPAPPAFPTSCIPFLHPNQPAFHLPPYIHNEPFYTDSFLLHQSSYFPLPPPPPPQDDADIDVSPISPPAVSSPLATSEPVRRGPRVITHKQYYEPKLSRARAGRGGSWLNGRGRGGGSRRRGSSREWLRRRGSSPSMLEERRGYQSRIYVEKHGTLPLRSYEKRTTVMIKNIPNEYTRWMLVEFMDKHCVLENRKTEQGITSIEAEQEPLSAYDFLYLPIDFGTGKNKGYAFVNFTEPQAVWKFFKECDSTKWDFKDSPKTRKIVCASIQGKEALVRHFQKTDFECESDEFLPLCFSPPRDGSGDSVKLTPIGNVGGRYLSNGSGRYHQTKHRFLV
ncbi:uncharacterized protein [Coffea arabica]|uniref:Mei2-like C-terminal RNA recognition motif domain-containing protein n=1 Tax=Coffea arabica TaxID=13443 RepID=A0ABM4WNI6_COFAR